MQIAFCLLASRHIIVTYSLVMNCKLILLLAFATLIAPMTGRSQEPQMLRNPVIPGYHPDPSVCRVGDTFYLVNSSFCSFPGVPLFESQDLVHWRQTGNVLTRPSQLPLKGANSWTGIYAPTIRYHQGRFYMITTNVGNGGNFLVTSTDARTWSEPVWLKQKGIDPSLFFEDGKCYMCSNPGDAIWLCEIDPATGRQLSESRRLWQGDGGRYPEGPHIYKKDGYYYLLISEGGTELAHRLTIARSCNIYGPYESNPANPILTNCSRRGQNMQVQGTGHGDFVQAADGSWWLVFLAYRNFGGAYHHLGRETFLAPVEWKAGEWPVVNGGQPIDTLMSVPALLRPGEVEVASPRGEKRMSGVEWVHIQNPIAGNYLYGKDGSLTMKAHGTLTGNNQPSFVGRRQEHAVVEAEAVVRTRGAEAGLTVYQINDGHYDLYIAPNPVSGYRVELRCKLKAIDYVVQEATVTSDKVWLKVTSDGLMYRFFYSEDGVNYDALGELNCSLLSSEVAGGFTGVLLGLYASGSGSALFEDFKYLGK